MKSLFKNILFVIAITLIAIFAPLSAESRFPKPEFDTPYQTPIETLSSVKGSALIDILSLAAALALSVYFIHKKRSRGAILILTIASLAWFGFFRKGCVCSVGSLQNIVLTFVQPTYKVPLVALFFFISPLIVSLFWGRAFCSSVCPLGAVQELVIVKPLRIPSQINFILGFFPYLHLGFAFVFVYSGLGFLICRFEPFVPLFRLSGSFERISFGLLLLSLGTVVARPYCRYLCAYGVLLKIGASVSKFRFKITKEKCISCHLCADSCPVQAILPPLLESPSHADKKKGVNNFLALLIASPLFVALSSFLFTLLTGFFTSLYPGVRQLNIEQRKFLQDRIHHALLLAGIFFGIVLCVRMFKKLIQSNQDIYYADKGDCIQCGRCTEHCPLPTHPFNIEEIVKK